MPRTWRLVVERGGARRSRTVGRARLILLAALAIVAAGAWSAIASEPASAQSGVVHTEPAEGASLDEAPDVVRIAFEDGIEADQVTLAVYDVHGNPVATERARAEADRQTSGLPLPADLPDGSYTVHWSVDGGDDQRSEGFYSFAVNRDTDMLVSSPPEPAIGRDAGWLEPGGRWLGLLGALLAGGVLLTWFAEIRPAVSERDEIRRRLGRTLRRVAIAGVGISLAGGLLALLGESIVTGGSISAGGIRDALTGTDFGRTLALQVVSLLALGVVLSIPALWGDRPGWKLPVLSLGLSGGVLLAFALSGNAGDELVGTSAAITIQWLHLASVGVWSGGLAAIGIALLAMVRSGAHEEVRPALARFCVVAGVSLVILMLSGVYGTVLHAGNLAALRGTDYGVALLTKIGLTLGLFVLTGALALWWGRGPHRGARSIPAALLIAVLVLAGVVIFQSGRLGTANMTAREEIASDAERAGTSFRAGDLDAALHLTPGVAGFNRITLDLAALNGNLDSSSTQAVVRVSPRDGVDGSREVLLRPEQICTADGAIIDSPVDRYEADTTLLSMAGDWELEVLVNRLETEDAVVSVPVQLRAGADEVDVPGPPLRFEGVQASLALLSAAAIVGLVAVILVRRRAGQSTDFYALGTAVLLFFTVLALWQGKITHTPDSERRNPIPRTIESVEAGREAFQTHCVECHGEDAIGNGPAASGLDRRPADLTADHVGEHPAGDMATWIRDGIDPAMPGFGDVLTEEEVWHLVNYVRSLSNPVTES